MRGSRKASVGGKVRLAEDGRCILTIAQSGRVKYQYSTVVIFHNEQLPVHRIPRQTLRCFHFVGRCPWRTGGKVRLAEDKSSSLPIGKCSGRHVEGHNPVASVVRHK